jgi:beta-1,4-mannooligosaccharide/beta-1,4-mannosyl-N-acetylglucosamine phosphorylase
MSTQQTILGPPLPNIPWEERPSGCNEVVWWSANNPIIPRDLIPCSNSIVNSAVVLLCTGLLGARHSGEL